MIKYRTFSMCDTEVVDRRQDFLGRLVERRQSVYPNSDRLYQAVAVFASGLGDRLVSITGSPPGGIRRVLLARGDGGLVPGDQMKNKVWFCRFC
jgi:hypothetical protein